MFQLFVPWIYLTNFKTIKSINRIVQSIKNWIHQKNNVVVILIWFLYVTFQLWIVNLQKRKHFPIVTSISKENKPVQFCMIALLHLCIMHDSCTDGLLQLCRNAKHEKKLKKRTRCAKCELFESFQLQLKTRFVGIKAHQANWCKKEISGIVENESCTCYHNEFLP